MSTEPNPDAAPPEPAAQDITEDERRALLKEVLQTLQEAFSAPGEGDDAETVTYLHQNAACAASDPSEPT